MPAHDRLRELVVCPGTCAEVLEVEVEAVEGGDIGTRPAGQDLEQPEVVHVLVGDHDQLELLDRVAMAGQRPLKLVERLAGVRAGVDQRERLVFDQVTVHPADEERRRYCQPMDPGAGRERE